MLMMPHQDLFISLDEEMIALQEHQQLNLLSGPDVFISQLDNVLVQGYPNDLTPPNNGASEILRVVHILEAASILCCMVAEPTLIYYGTGRIMVASTALLSPSSTKRLASAPTGMDHVRPNRPAPRRIRTFLRPAQCF